MLLHSTPMDHPMYRIRIVDASDDDIANILADLHQSTFFDAAPLPQFELGAWWLAYHGDEPVAFAGVVPSTHIRNGGYFSRVGVLQRHRGRDLQCRLMRVIEARARRTGRDSIVPDTTDNPVSANNSSGRAIGSSNPMCPGLGRIRYWRKWLR
jgi:GNAT superfamily N-acetyltransferase